MATIFDYLSWRGDLTMEQSPLNELDGLIFSRLCYLPFEDRVADAFDQWVSLKQLVESAVFVARDDSYAHYTDDVQLFNAAVECPRFSDLRVSGYRHTLQPDLEEQFSAIVFEVTPDTLFVAYRGTDENIVGWKENFNMAFLSPVPAQQDAVQYVEAVSAAFPRHKLILGGHSKGGNLALYAGALCGSEVQEQIVSVYNYDGPGFNSDVVSHEGFAAIEPKVLTFVPQYSVVGMLLERQERYIVVQSKEVNFSQHNLYLWETARNHFVYLEDVSESTAFFDRTIKTWVETMDANQLEQFVEALFGMIGSTQAETLPQLASSWFDNARTISKTWKNADPKTQEALSGAFQLLKKAAQDNFSSWRKEDKK